MSNYDDIYLDFEAFDLEDVTPLANMLNDCKRDNLQEISEVDLLSTVIGPRAFLNFYNAFRTLVLGYIDCIIRDLCSVADMASSFMQYDGECFDGDIGIAYELANDFNRDDFSSLSLSYSVDTDIVLDNDWFFYKSDMDDEIAVILRNLLEFMWFVPNLKQQITSFSATQNFRGQAAEAAKNYFATIHGFGCDALYVCTQTAFLWISQYWVPYRQSPEFEVGIEGVCILIKPDIVELRDSLQAKKDALEEKYPQISTHNTTLASDTNNAYDYSVNLTCLYSLPDYISDAITSCNDIIGFVENFEPLVLSSIMPEIDSVMQEFYNFASQLTGLTRNDFIYPPADINEVYSLDEYGARLAEVQIRNEYQMTGVLNAGLEETLEVNEELALEAAERQLALEIVGDTITIIGAILSIVLTEGGTLAYAVVVIGDAVTITSSAIDIGENIYDIQQIRNGEIDPDGTNFVCDVVLGFIEDPEDRNRVYLVLQLVGDVIQIAGTVAGAGIDGSDFNVEDALSSLEFEVSALAIEEGMTVLGEDGTVAELVMIPVELSFNGDMPGYSDVCDGLSSSFSLAAEWGNEYTYDDWTSDLNSTASYGVVGGGGFTSGVYASN